MRSSLILSAVVLTVLAVVPCQAAGTCQQSMSIDDSTTPAWMATDDSDPLPNDCWYEYRWIDSCCQNYSPPRMGQKEQKRLCCYVIFATTCGSWSDTGRTECYPNYPCFL